MLAGQGQIPGLGGGITADIDDFPGEASTMALTTSGCIPDRGGSVMITDGRPSLANSPGVNSSLMSPARKETFSRPLARAFTQASSVASTTYSNPTTFRHQRERNRAMVPVPLYRSYTISSPVTRQTP